MNATNEIASVRLSIAIATYNRAPLLRAMLGSIVRQATQECEIVISDNASTDETELVVTEFKKQFGRIRYAKQSAHVDLDCNFDRAVELASGEYCWLMADDDLLAPTAVATIINALCRDYSLIVVNYERKSFDMSRTLVSPYLDIKANRIYTPDQYDCLLADAASLLIYIGCIIVKREIWLARDRKPYYGSMQMYLAVVLQRKMPGETLLVAQPLVIYREGNTHVYSSGEFEILLFWWPQLVWSLIGPETANKIIPKEPWRKPGVLIIFRALGDYSLAEYRKLIHPRLGSMWEKLAPALIATAPGILVNALAILYWSCSRNYFRTLMLYNFRTSPFYLRNWWNRRVVSFAAG